MSKIIWKMESKDGKNFHQTLERFTKSVAHSRRYVISDLRHCQVKMNSYASVDTRAFTYQVRNGVKTFSRSTGT